MSEGIWRCGAVDSEVMGPVEAEGGGLESAPPVGVVLGVEGVLDRMGRVSTSPPFAKPVMQRDEWDECSFPFAAPKFLHLLRAPL